MKLPESEHEYLNALVDAAELGAKKALQNVGIIAPYLSQRQAGRLYGTGKVRRWIKEGLITPVKDGDKNSTVRIDRIQLEAVAKTANRASYFMNKI